MIHDHDYTSIPESDGKGVVVGKKSDPPVYGLSPWTTQMDYPKNNNGLCRWSLVIRVTKLGE